MKNIRFAIACACCALGLAACSTTVDDPEIDQSMHADTEIECTKDCDDTKLKCVADCDDDSCKATCKTDHDDCVTTCDEEVEVNVVDAGS
jgi:hypothetical protein